MTTLTEKQKLVVTVHTYDPVTKEMVETRKVDFLIKHSGRWLRAHMFWAFANGLAVNLTVDNQLSTFVNERPDLGLKNNSMLG